MTEHDDDRRGTEPALAEPSAQASEAQPEPHRRAFIALSVVGTCAIGAVAAIPAAMMIADPLRASGETAKRFLVAKLEELEPGVPKRVAVVGDEVDAWTRAKARRLGAVWLVRTGAREVRALSTICPHLGCGIEATADGKGFACPCHTSFFELTGKIATGPSPRGMDALPVEIGAKGEVFVTWKRYRIGGSGQEELT
jgi:Rieske Fe-S protein